MKTVNYLRLLSALMVCVMTSVSAYAADKAVEKEEVLRPHGIDNENLDVNINPIYLSARPQKNTDLQSEVIFQVPVPLTEKADKTGLGPIASFAYFDNKSFVHIKTESATVRGAGRFYYIASGYGVQNTFVPYLTLYRDALIGYRNSTGKDLDSKSKAWFTPGFLYAHRVSDRVVWHLDGELYNYSRPGNNSTRIGASYALSRQWVVSLSYERMAWDMQDSVNTNISMQGRSDNVYLKLMSSKPLKDNFAFILGFASNKNNPGSGLRQESLNRVRGLFLGLEASLGTLVW